MPNFNDDRMLSIFLVLFLICLVPVFNQSIGWEEVYPLEGASIGFTAIATTPSGKIAYALRSGYTNLLYTRDNGTTWTNCSDATLNVYGVACSDSGQFVYLVGQGGVFLGSNNYCSSFTWGTNPAFSQTDLMAVATSGNGSQIYIPSYSTNLYHSSDYGMHWKTIYVGSGNVYSGVASSVSGKYVYISANYGTGALFSSDYGSTWSASENVGSCKCASITCSYDGRHVYMINSGSENLYISNNYGNWFNISNVGEILIGVTTTGTGQYVFVTGAASGIYESQDFGITWTSLHVPSSQIFSAIATTTTGNYSFAVSSQGFIYRGLNFTTTMYPTSTPSSPPTSFPTSQPSRSPLSLLSLPLWVLAIPVSVIFILAFIARPIRGRFREYVYAPSWDIFGASSFASQVYGLLSWMLLAYNTRFILYAVCVLLISKGITIVASLMIILPLAGIDSVILKAHPYPLHLPAVGLKTTVDKNKFSDWKSYCYSKAEMMLLRATSTLFLVLGILNLPLFTLLPFQKCASDDIPLEMLLGYPSLQVARFSICITLFCSLLQLIGGGIAYGSMSDTNTSYLIGLAGSGLELIVSIASAILVLGTLGAVRKKPMAEL